MHRFVATLLMAATAFADGIASAQLSNTTTRTIPASASAHGLNGMYFQTDLTLSNLSPDGEAFFGLTYLCSSGCPDTQVPPFAGFYLSGREVRVFPDVVRSVFGLSESAGAISIYRIVSGTAPAPWVATSRTSATTASGCAYGMAVPAASYFYPGSGGYYLLLDLASSGGDLTTGYRTNVGIVNPLDRGFLTPFPVTVTLNLFTSSGTQIGSPLVLVVSGAAQVNDVFRAVGGAPTPFEHAYLTIQSTGAILPYATVIDNVTGAPWYVPPTQDIP